MILAASPWWNTAPAIGAALAYLLLAFSPRSWEENAKRALLWLAWALHALALGSALWSDGSRFGFAPALSVTVWLVFAVYALESQMYPRLATNWTFAGVGTGAVLLAWVFPGTHHPTQSVPWLQLHWALGLASYSLLGMAVLHAWLMQRAEQSMRQALANSPTLPLLALERLTFRFVGAAFALLTLTLLAGWGFTDWSTAPHGPWTHKTVFTLASWGVLGALLWGRWQRGWRGRLACRMLYAAAGLLLLGYVGSRFVLEVVLQRS